MKATEIMKRSFRTAWNNKRLWIFGLFVAAMSSGSGGNNSNIGDGGFEGLPWWLPLVIAATAIVALVFLAMNIISEAALIVGVDRARIVGDRSLGFKEGLAHGLRHFKPVLLLKALYLALNGLSIGVVAVPAVLSALEIWPLWLGLSITAPLAIVAIPWLLTLYFLRQYALRIAVLDGCGSIEALRGGWDHLHGRIASSLALLGVSLVGIVASSLAMGVLMIPAAIVGGLVYLVAGLLPAAIAGSVLVFPAALCVTGFQGTYRSSVWTHGYLEATAHKA